MVGAPDSLKQLQSILRTPGLPLQAALARNANVDQTFVSRARLGKLKHPSEKADRLLAYVTAVAADLRSAELRAAVAEATPEFFAINAEQVLQVVQRYLDDGLDASLLVEQVSILRRAQRRRAGRPLKF